MNAVAQYKVHDVRPLPSGPQTLAQRILNAVLHVSGLKRTELSSERRHADLVHWRHIAMELLRRHTPLSYPKIGRLLGGRDHSTIIHGVKTVRSNPALYDADIKRVEALL